MKLAWSLLTNNITISQQEVEKLKQCDLLEEMLRELTGEFPTLSHVFMTERDMYLAHSLRLAARPVPCSRNEEGSEGMETYPAVVVGVVGIGHQAGIERHWEDSLDIDSLMHVPPTSIVNVVSRYVLFAILIAVVAIISYKIFEVGSGLSLQILRAL